MSKETEQRINLSPAKWLWLVVAIIALTIIAVLLDIYILRQAVGFIFLTFVPGLLLLYLLKLDRLGLSEKIVLSVGLSVVFCMLLGIIVNSLLPALGNSKPLSTLSLLVSFSLVTVILAIIVYIRNKGVAFSLSNFRLTTSDKAFLVVPLLFPLLSIVGMRLMNLTNNNVILMLLLFLIPAYVIFISFFNRKVSEKVYPSAILLIGISLLLMYSLRSNHIIGSDTHRELIMFQTVFTNMRWSQLGFGPMDACLSISLLPAVYQNFMNANQEFLFKLLYSFIFSVSPLIVYVLSRKYIGSFYAFLASIFFMSQTAFLWTPAAARTDMAILFFALAVLVLFHDGISEVVKKALFIVFAAAMVVSHYGATYVAFFVLLFVWIGMEILFGIAPRENEATLLAETPNIEGAPQTRLKRGITTIIIALFLVMLFFWYSQMTGPSFYAGVQFMYKSFTGLQWFLAEEANVEQPVQAAFGKAFPYTGVPQRIELVVSWLTIVLLGIGVLATTILPVIRKFKPIVSTVDSVRKRFEAEYLMLAGVCFLMLVAVVMVPYASKYYGTARTYLQMLVPLSLFLVIGGMIVAKYLKSRPYWIILIVLVPYFLCTTGAMTQVFGFPRAVTLNSEGPLYGTYISDAESDAAKWLKEYGDPGTMIYALGGTQDIILSQGRIPGYGMAGSRILEFQKNMAPGSYIYLRQSEVDKGVLVKQPDKFAGKGKIYSSNGSEIYK